MNKNIVIHKKDDKLKAAYALNLCTVSISQIIDYQDLNILEEQYELVLNNLNLHNMPKDQALLNVLKQILDTVTFFRITEGDKAIIEKKYQQKVNNAIWNAIPSFGLIAVGDPYTFAISMLASVGMGYMNYRKEKARTNIEREEQEWQLQRTAIEQFNALRRELFETAWRLADTYDFEDKYRLTESQIAQYNNALMDPNVLRKYERLESIKEDFEAYSPFWYYIANAARDVAYMYQKEEPYEEVLCAISKYNILAEKYYKKFLDVDIDLLRVNHIRSACELEYVALLIEKDPSLNKQDVILLVDDAVSHCGSKFDILQHAAIYYLKLEEIGKAEYILRKLVIEGYNTKTNSQLLSFIYLQESVLDKGKFNDYTLKYRELIQFVDRACLLPWVDSEKDLSPENMNRINTKFLKSQRELLDYEFECIVDAIVAREATAYNKRLYMLHYLDVSDSFFEDTLSAQKIRKDEFSKLCNNDKEWNRYVSELSRGQISLILDEHVNLLLKKLTRLSFLAFSADIENVVNPEDIRDIFMSKVNGISIVERVTDLENKVNNRNFSFSDYEKLSSLTFSQILRTFVEEFKIQFEIEGIGDKNKYQELASIESCFMDYCLKEQLPSLEKLCSLGQYENKMVEDHKFFDLLSCFGHGKGTEERRNKEEQIIKIFKECENKHELILQNKEGYIFTTDSSKICQRIKEIDNAEASKINNMGRPLAYFHDHKKWNERAVDLFFYGRGIYRMRSAKIAMTDLNFYLYKDINIDRENKELYIEEGNKAPKKRIVIYDSNEINLEVLYKLINESSKIAQK